LRRELHHPAVQRGKIDFDAAFSHDLLKIPIRDTEANIEKYSVKDRALGEMVPFEINRRA
jgi:hypothetical protein